MPIVYLVEDLEVMHGRECGVGVGGVRGEQLSPGGGINRPPDRVPGLLKIKQQFSSSISD